jgi:hypothetical protein
VDPVEHPPDAAVAVSQPPKHYMWDAHRQPSSSARTDQGAGFLASDYGVTGVARGTTEERFVYRQRNELRAEQLRAAVQDKSSVSLGLSNKQIVAAIQRQQAVSTPRGTRAATANVSSFVLD